MAVRYSDEVKSLLQRYIDSMAEERQKLKQALQSISANNRYSLLMEVRGVKWSANTGLHLAARQNDLEMIKHMMLDFTTDQVYCVVSIETPTQGTSLHYAACNGHNDVIRYLLDRVPQQHMFESIGLEKANGNTALHDAAINKHKETVQLILSYLTPTEQLQLWSVRNEDNKSVAEMLPETYPPYPGLSSFQV